MNAPPEQRLVCYLIVYRPGTHCVRQWFQSVRSLRRYNRHIPIVLCLYADRAIDEIEREADRHHVQIIRLGSFEASLRHPKATPLAFYPCWGKLLSLRHAPAADRLLYLDCDTYFFDDVQHLFDQHQDADWFARDEVLSRRGYPDEYDPAYLDEDHLEVIVRMLGGRFIAPFNGGIWLMRRWVLQSFLDREYDFLDLAWRLAVGAMLRNDPDAKDRWSVMIRAATGPEDLARALPYPSSNSWIVDEVATWLLLGQVPGLVTAPLQPALVPQSNMSYLWDLASWPIVWPVVAHYFGGNERSFFSVMPRLP